MTKKKYPSKNRTKRTETYGPLTVKLFHERTQTLGRPCSREQYFSNFIGKS